MTKRKAIILQTATTAIMPLQLLFSLFLLLRGHNQPGGGFIAGLVAAGAVALYTFAFGVAAAKALLRVEPLVILAVGLLVAISSAFPAIFTGDPLMTTQRYALSLPGLGTVKVSTPLWFDCGVYLAVIGAVLTVLIALSEAKE